MARPAGTPPIAWKIAGFSVDGIANHAGEADPHPGYQRESERSQPNGYASLDPTGRVPSAELPAATTTGVGVVALGSLFAALWPDVFGSGGADLTVGSSGSYQLTADAEFENVTVMGSLYTRGFRLRVAGTLTLNGGTIHCSGASGQSGGGAGGHTSASYAAGTAGGAGGTNAQGAISNPLTNNWGALHVPGACKGGNGGASSGGAEARSGGVAGGTTAPAVGAFESQATWDTGYLFGSSSARMTPGTGGAGGGGGTTGGGAANGVGGTGGGGAGVCAVFARRLVNVGGAIEAKGGNGAPGTGAAGGGGGGGGGIVIVRYAELVGTTPALSVAGGSGGPGSGPGNAGANGTAGYSSVRSVVRLP